MLPWASQVSVKIERTSVGDQQDDEESVVIKVYSKAIEKVEAREIGVINQIDMQQKNQMLQS
jgi:hypothetical protein